VRFFRTVFIKPLTAALPNRVVKNTPEYILLIRRGNLGEFDGKRGWGI
jgi:hypothetical protein